MLAVLTANVGNIVVLGILAIVVGLGVRSLVNGKRKGKSACGCDCGSCSSAGFCHRTEK